MSLEKTSLKVEGMSCGHCVMAVRKAVQALPGIRTLEVEVGKADVEFDPRLVQVEAIARAIGEAGFQASAAG